jgi:hypothetical protein
MDPAIREYVADSDEETLQRTMGSAAAVIVQIVPEIKDRLPGLGDPTQIDDLESARFRLFDSITNFLKSASGRSRLL